MGLERNREEVYNKLIIDTTKKSEYIWNLITNKKKKNI